MPNSDPWDRFVDLYLTLMADSYIILLHYANMSVQYTAIVHGCKNGNFQMKKCGNFLIFAQNIDRGYALEPPQWGGSNEYPQSMF